MITDEGNHFLVQSEGSTRARALYVPKRSWLDRTNIGTSREFSSFGKKEASAAGAARAKATLLKSGAVYSMVAHGGSFSRQLKMGCDPELFLQENGKLLPAFEVLRSKKENLREFWDGFQGEFTTQPHSCLVELCMEIFWGMIRLRDSAVCKKKDASFLLADAVPVDTKLLADLAPEYVELGCDPSINIYGTESGVHSDPRQMPWRFAGGHIHFGDGALAAMPQHLRLPEAAKRVHDLDKTLGIWATLAFAALETTKVRRKYYGLAGEFRLPKHGLEYRTLGPWWICAPSVYYLTFELARVFYRASVYKLLDFWVATDDEIQCAINEYNVDVAKRVLARNEKLFNYIVPNASHNFTYYGVAKLASKQALRLAYEGVGALLKQPLAVEENWTLNTDRLPEGCTWASTCKSWK